MVVGVASVCEWLDVVDGVGWVGSAVGAGVVVSCEDGESDCFPLCFASDVAFACGHQYQPWVVRVARAWHGEP